MAEMLAERPGVAATNPATGERGKLFPLLSPAEVTDLLGKADRAFQVWRTTPVEERAEILRKAAAYCREHAERFARDVTLEMGKPIRQARAEMEKCASVAEWYADNGPAMIADEPTQVGEDAYVSFLPLGTVLVVAPWNFPLWQSFRATVPTLLAGNAVLLKHATNCQQTAYNVQEAFLAAGLPEGLLGVLNIGHDQTEGVLADPRVVGVSVTGSVRAGSTIAAIAGRYIKRSVLELGGSDPFIVLADADLDGAVKAAMAGRFTNCGQICIAAKRMIVEKPVVEAFTTKLVAAVEALKTGDPLDEATDIGPMARMDLRDELDQQVQRTIAEGAQLLTGGKAVGPDHASFYEPTVLAGVTRDMTAFREETFGPVAAIITAEDAEEAIDLANDSEFGLSGAIWTRDIALARTMARRLDTGGVFINGFAASDPRVPIGGIKHSGYGRELSYFGLREFTNPQIVWKDRA